MLVDKLLEYGAFIDGKVDSQGTSLFLKLCAFECPSADSEALICDLIAFVIARGADVKKKNSDGKGWSELVKSNNVKDRVFEAIENKSDFVERTSVEDRTKFEKGVESVCCYLF